MPASGQPDDPFAKAAGRIGAAPAPSWGQGAEPTPHDQDSAPSADHRARSTGADAAPPAGSVYSEATYGTGNRLYGRGEGYSSRYGRRYRYRRYRGAEVPQSRVWLVVLGFPTLGLLWLIGAVVHWVGFSRARRANGDQRAAKRLMWWAITFTTLTALAILFWVAVGIAGNSDNGGSDALPTSSRITRPLGQAATVIEPVAAKGSDVVPVTVTFNDFADPTTLPGQVKSPGHAAPDTATGTLKVCALSHAVDPMAVVFSLQAQTTGNTVDADFDSAFENTPLRNPLRPYQCVSGVVGFAVPAEWSVQSVQFGILGGVSWTVPSRSGSAEPQTT